MSPRESGYRRAALALHGLASDDRRWLLEQLEAGQRRKLGALLGELDALELRFAPDDIAALTAERPAASASGPALPGDDALDGFDADAITAALADEPDWAVAVLWAACTPVAQRRLLSALPAERREAIASTGRRSAAPPLLQRAAWFGALGHRVEQGGSTVAAGTTASGNRITPWLR